MYKNILLPVDGSAFGRGTIPYTMALAKATGARVTALHVTLPREELAIERSAPSSCRTLTPSSPSRMPQPSSIP